MQTPQQLWQLALKRRRNPWNWLVQLTGVLLLCVSLTFAYWPFFVFGAVFVGVSFLEIPLAPAKGWVRDLAAEGMQNEDALLGWMRGSRRRKMIVWGIVAGALLIFWAGDAMLWSLLAAVVSLICVVLHNKRNGF